MSDEAGDEANSESLFPQQYKKLLEDRGVKIDRTPPELKSKTNSEYKRVSF